MTNATDRLSAALADRYRIIEHLGEGGMANVYLAEDLKHQRKVGIKVLRPELAAVRGAPATASLWERWVVNLLKTIRPSFWSTTSCRNCGIS